MRYASHSAGLRTHCGPIHNTGSVEARQAIGAQATMGRSAMPQKHRNVMNLQFSSRVESVELHVRRNMSPSWSKIDCSKMDLSNATSVEPCHTAT